MRGEHLEESNTDEENKEELVSIDKKTGNKDENNENKQNKENKNIDVIDKIEENFLSQTAIIKSKGQVQLIEYEEFEKTCEDLDGWDDLNCNSED